MKYEILGPLRVVDRAGRSSFISARKVEILLAVLLLRSDEVVTLDQLVAEIWGERSPRRAMDTLYVYVSQLRKFLNRFGEPESRVITRAPGYQLRLGADELDVHTFQQLAQYGRGHIRHGCYEQAAACCERALALWRGPALDYRERGPIVDGFIARLEEERLECVETLVDARLALGRHRELVGRLFSLIAEYPLREMFYVHLMQALYRCGRQADALRVYQSARARLNGDLGLEPCRALQEMQRAILNSDRELETCMAA